MRRLGPRWRPCRPVGRPVGPASSLVPRSPRSLLQKNSATISALPRRVMPCWSRPSCLAMRTCGDGLRGHLFPAARFKWSPAPLAAPFRPSNGPRACAPARPRPLQPACTGCWGSCRSRCACVWRAARPLAAEGRAGGVRRESRVPPPCLLQLVGAAASWK